jgi:hypothetical protein
VAIGVVDHPPSAVGNRAFTLSCIEMTTGAHWHFAAGACVGTSRDGRCGHGLGGDLLAALAFHQHQPRAGESHNAGEEVRPAAIARRPEMTSRDRTSSGQRGRRRLCVPRRGPGTGRNSSTLSTLKMAVLTPMPIASDRTARLRAMFGESAKAIAQVLEE